MLKFTKTLILITLATALTVTSASAWITPEEVDSTDSNCTKGCTAKYTTIYTTQGNFVFPKNKAVWATKKFKTEGKLIVPLKGSHE